MIDDIKSQIKSEAYKIGFDDVRFTAPILGAETAKGLKAFVEQNHHGDMEWMAEKAHLRSDPKALWPETASIIVLGHNYGPDFDPMTKLEQKNIGVISSYALNQDYHDVIKKRLKKLGRWLIETYGGDIKVFVDTAPVMEKPIAQQSGLGWQGKHTCLVSRDYGSWLFIGSIFTTLVIEPDVPEINHCGSCSNCIDICPTNAFTAEYKLDARKCISYLTIEHKGQIPVEFRKAIGNRIYGCDDCLAVCPWNKFAQTANEIAYQPRDELEAPSLQMLLQLDDGAFRKLFSKSPVKRIGRDRFVRNVLIAAGNSGDSNLLPYIRELQQDTNILVNEMAHWAHNEIENKEINQ